MNLKEMKMLVKMKTAMGESVDQSILDQIAEEEARLVADQEKEAVLAEERKAAFGSVFTDLAKDIGRLMQEDKKRTAEQQDVVNRFGSLLQTMAGKQPQMVQENIEAPLPISEKIEEPKNISFVDAVVQKVNETSSPSMFVQPEPQIVDKNIQAIQQKLKLLEGWVSKISMSGPGGGEVLFRYLDDVVRNTMTPSNDNWVLEYDAATKKVQFTEDVGPIRTIKMNTSGPTTNLVAGQIAWNSIEDCLDIRHADGSTLQAGLENYIQVRNETGSTLEDGTVVRFSGVFVDEDYIPTCVPHIADGSVPTLYLIGVLTNTIPTGSSGRATVLGKVRDLDTTGTSMGEVWAPGDILWAHPTMPGKMTKVQPTAPNVVTSVAAVLRAHSINGVILVRPTFFPRLFYGKFSDTTTQTAAAINTGYEVTINTTDIASGFNRGTSTSHIVTQNSGLYKYDFSLQFTSTNSSLANAWVWYRKNGVNVPRSTRKISIAQNGGSVVFSHHAVLSMVPGDYFELMWAVDSTNMQIVAPAATSFAPSTPSVDLTVAQINL